MQKGESMLRKRWRVDRLLDSRGLVKVQRGVTRRVYRNGGYGNSWSPTKKKH